MCDIQSGNPHHADTIRVSVVFFFSSRRRHTRFDCDWSSDVCSSDLFAALLFGGAGALGPALQSVGITSGYYLFNAAPYVLTLLLMIATSSTQRTLKGAPSELSVTK